VLSLLFVVVSMSAAVVVAFVSVGVGAVACVLGMNELVTVGAIVSVMSLLLLSKMLTELQESETRLPVDARRISC